MTTRTNRMPRPRQSPRVSPVPISSLVMELRRFQAREGEVRAEYPWADRFVMGLPLAPWQRQLKWDAGQMQRFITSAWSGVHLGTYVLTDAQIEPGEEIRYVRLANCVIDGQQRLHALERYLSDALAVPDVEGTLTLWSELDLVERRWFEKRIFERGTTPLVDEMALRAAYDLMNFGGQPHLEDERALPRELQASS